MINYAARLRLRYLWGLVASFAIMVLLPLSSVYAISSPDWWFNEYDTVAGRQVLGSKQIDWCYSNLNKHQSSEVSVDGMVQRFINECIDPTKEGPCTVKPIDANNPSHGTLYECSAGRKAELSKEQSLKIDAAIRQEADGLVVLLCGVAQTDSQASQQIPCAKAVRKAYYSPQCYYQNGRDSKDGTASDDFTAKCVYAALKNNPDIRFMKPVVAIKDAITKGRKATSDQVNSTVEDIVSKSDCESKGGTWKDGKCQQKEDTSTCVVDGVGWIVCAVANFMATITDGMYEHVIANMLSVPPLNVDTADGENGTYNAWSSIRNIANVLFVIAFLIVVYSQITGLGISNYAIKKMLPRIVLSAILVNLSYWIAAVGVDVSNILGAGIYAMLQGIRGGLNIGNVNGWAAVTTMLLSGGAIAGGVVLGGAITVVAVGAMTPAIAMALIGILLPLLLGALLAIFIVIFILVARQALVVILIIASPLAFVAFLLPNTQQWFTKWRQWFVSLLLLYPIVSFMVGGAQIAGLVLISTASNGFTDVIGDTIKIMSGLFVMVVPFFFLPFMIRRYGGAGLDRLAGSIKAKGGKLIAPVGKVGRKMGMQAMGRQWESLKAGNAPAMRRSRFGGRLGRGIDRLRTGAAQGATRGAQGYSQWQARNKMESEHYADQQQPLRTLSRDERIALAHGRTVTTAAGHTIVPDVAMQEAAIKSVAPSMDSREALDLADALGGGHGVDAAVRRAGVESLAGKAPQLTGSQLGALEGDTYSRDAATLAGLTGGKFDADWMATKAKADDIDELVAHIAGTTDPAERARLQAIVDDAVGKLDSTDAIRARVVAGSDLDQALDRLASRLRHQRKQLYP